MRPPPSICLLYTSFIKPLGIPVIFLTAKGTMADKVKGLRLGADDYLVKPFEIVELLARVCLLYTSRLRAGGHGSAVKVRAERQRDNQAGNGGRRMTCRYTTEI